ncbi:PAAR-like domain-containing protein, partial [Escherichia coli]
MGNYHIGDGECRFRVVCSSPDVCEVGGYKVPFDSYQTLDSERQYSSTVWARGCRALNVGSVIAGTQSNAGKGVISGTSQGTGDCVILTGSPTVTIEG